MNPNKNHPEFSDKWIFVRKSAQKKINKTKKNLHPFIGCHWYHFHIIQKKDYFWKKCFQIHHFAITAILKDIQAQGQSYIQNQILPRIKHKMLSLAAALWAQKFKKDTFFLQVYKWGSIAWSLSNEKCSTVDLAWLSDTNAHFNQLLLPLLNQYQSHT